jgi:hypothetical protein
VKESIENQHNSARLTIDVATQTDPILNGNKNGHRNNGAVAVKNRFHVKHMIAIASYSVVFILLVVANLRMGMHVFCHYDENFKGYIVMEMVEQCPVPITPVESDDSCPFWKKCIVATSEDYVNTVVERS